MGMLDLPLKRKVRGGTQSGQESLTAKTPREERKEQRMIAVIRKVG
jgi:hypothetical protein